MGSSLEAMQQVEKVTVEVVAMLVVRVEVQLQGK